MAIYPVQAQRDDDSIRVQAVFGPVQHFTIHVRMGFDPLLVCPCGATIELDYFTDYGGVTVMTEKLAVFLDEHEGCET